MVVRVQVLFSREVRASAGVDGANDGQGGRDAAWLIGRGGWEGGWEGG